MRQVVTVNSIPTLTALKFFLMKERLRHIDDIRQIDKDLDKMRDITVPTSLDLEAWCEVEKGRS